MFAILKGYLLSYYLYICMGPYLEKYAIPVSIVLAGLLIGSGIVLSGGISVDTSATINKSDTKKDDSQPVSFAPVDNSDHIRGNTQARVTLLEYSDLECPFCQSVHPTLEQLVADYQGEVRWVYRHFPLESIHAQARPAAIASECVAQIGGAGAFWDFIDAIFEDQKTQLPKIRSIALATGVGGAQYDSCVAQEDIAADVDADIADGIAAGVTGTPHTLVIGPNGEVVPMVGAQPMGAFKTVIDEMLK